MGTYRLAVLPGDGIGPAVVDAAVQVLTAVSGVTPGLDLDFLYLPVGLEAYERFGSTLPEQTLQALPGCQGWLLGPLSTHLYRPNDPLMPNVSGWLRKHFSLYANIRPARHYPGFKVLQPGLDVVIVRENTEGFYADRNLISGPGEIQPTPDVVVSVRVVTRAASLRLARVAFELARRRARLRPEGNARLVVVHKANVLRLGCGLFRAAFAELAPEFPDVQVSDLHVDAAAANLILHAEQYDVMATTNMFGDILSDVSAALVGGLGVAPGLNVGDPFLMGQAVHGSAPDIADRGLANPCAEILSGKLLLEWLGHRHADPAALTAAARIEQAVAQVLAEGRLLTPDLGGKATTRELAGAISAGVGGL